MADSTVNNAGELVLQLRGSTQRWVSSVYSLSDKMFNEARGSAWSPAQLLTHVSLTERGIVKLLHGASEPASAERPPLFERMHRGLTDHTRKLKAPEFLEPRKQDYSKEDAVEKFKANREALEQIALTAPNLDQVFTVFPHPYFGLLTGFEWFHNIVLHADRHYRQLENMIAVTNGSETSL
jgi:hypothetical protein